MRPHDSIIHSLQHLKDLLDAGAINLQEHELIKQKLIASMLEDQENTKNEYPVTITPESREDDNYSPGHLSAYELVEEPGPPPQSAEHGPPMLDVDHLLQLAEGHSELQHQQETPSFHERAELDAAKGYGKTTEAYFEPEKIANFADFSPLRGREPRPSFFESGNLLNLVLLVSIIALTIFGGYIFFHQDEWESERLSSSEIQKAVGMALEDRPVVSSRSFASPDQRSSSTQKQEKNPVEPNPTGGKSSGSTGTTPGKADSKTPVPESRNPGVAGEGKESKARHLSESDPLPGIIQPLEDDETGVDPEQNTPFPFTEPQIIEPDSASGEERIEEQFHNISFLPFEGKNSA
jgi:hypothetical protein